MKGGAHPEVIPQFRVGFELTVIWATTVTTDETTVLIFDGIITWYVGIYNCPHVGVSMK
jgi:hypothetical protein